MKTRSPFVLSSVLFDDVFAGSDLLCGLIELRVLLMSDFDSHPRHEFPQISQPKGCHLQNSRLERMYKFICNIITNLHR